MMKKGILLIGNYPPPFGGVPRHIEYLVPYLVGRGWDVHVLSAGTSGVERKNGFTVYKDDRARTVKLLSSIGFLLKATATRRLNCFRLAQFVPFRYWLSCVSRASLGRQIVEKNSVSLISAYNLYGGALVGAILSRVYHIPLVVTNLGEIYSMRDFFERYRELVRYICESATRFLSPTHHCAESYGLLGFSPDVEVVRYGMDVKAFCPGCDASIIKQRLGISDSDKVVLFVGRMIKDMGLHTLLEAIPKVLQSNGEIKVVIVGARGELLPHAIQLTKEYAGGVSVIPDVPLEELPLYYAASTILVAPTQGDRACGSLAAAEAMATGKPVIASNVGGIPEFVADGETGILIPPEEPAVLGETILNLLANETLIQNMGARGRRRVEALFDKDKTNQQHERLYSEVAGV